MDVVGVGGFSVNFRRVGWVVGGAGGAVVFGVWELDFMVDRGLLVDFCCVEVGSIASSVLFCVSSLHFLVVLTGLVADEGSFGEL